MKRYGKQIAIGVIMLLTGGAFVWYVLSHPDYLAKLAHTDPLALVWLFLVNAALLGTLILLYRQLIRLCGSDINPMQNVLLTIYSSVANFFGPLQSGPGVRAIYLKKKLGISIARYTFATLLYYACFAVLNVFLLLVSTRPIWQVALAIICAVTGSAVVLRWYTKRKNAVIANKMHLTGGLLASIAGLTLLQVLFLTVRYYIDLTATGTSVSVGQAASYTGAANLALFVSITPDGIGIREAFLLFSQQLHGVSTDHIVSASLLDRASYVLFLAVIFIGAMVTQGTKKLTSFRTGV